MSNVNTITDQLSINAGSSGAIVMTFAAPTNQSANVVFNCTTVGTAGGTPTEFSVGICDSLSGGTSASLTQTHIRANRSETPQGTWLTWSGGAPSAVSGAIRERIIVPCLSSGFTPPVEVPGGKTAYLFIKNATTTATLITGKCNQ